MTDLPQNSPIDLRAHVLYDKYQGFPTEKSYSNYKKLCITFGKEAISYDDYKYWFKKYSKKTGRDLSDIRGCILSDVINGKTAEKSIDDLCDAFKNHKIDKEDHDYWHKRFENGHSFTRTTFSDFPEDVISEIVERCDMNLNLRNVSFGLRTVIDQLPPPCSAIEVYCGYCWIDVTVGSYPQMEAIEIGVLELLLRNPKLRLKDFMFHIDFDYEDVYQSTRSVVRLLNSLNHKIHVKNCSISTEEPEDVIGILRCFKPGTLEGMQIMDGFTFHDIYDIAKMDQWKQAKHLELRMYKTSFPPMEHFLHFSTIKYFGSITLPDVVNLCDSVSKWTNFEHIKIENQARLDTEKVERALNLQPTASPEVYTIPNSNLLIQFERSWNWNLQVLKIYKK